MHFARKRRQRLEKARKILAIKFINVLDCKFIERLPKIKRTPRVRSGTKTRFADCILPQNFMQHLLGTNSSSDQNLKCKNREAVIINQYGFEIATGVSERGAVQVIQRDQTPHPGFTAGQLAVLSVAAVMLLVFAWTLVR